MPSTIEIVDIGVLDEGRPLSKWKKWQQQRRRKKKGQQVPIARTTIDVLRMIWIALFCVLRSLFGRRGSLEIRLESGDSSTSDSKLLCMPGGF